MHVGSERGEDGCGKDCMCRRGCVVEKMVKECKNGKQCERMLEFLSVCDAIHRDIKLRWVCPVSFSTLTYCISYKYTSRPLDE